AAAICRKGLLLAGRQSAHLVVTASDLHTRLAMFNYEWNALDTALHHITIARQIARAGDYRINLILINDILALILRARGDFEGARAAMIEADQFVTQHSNNSQLGPLLVAARLRRHL